MADFSESDAHPIEPDAPEPADPAEPPGTAAPSGAAKLHSRRTVVLLATAAAVLLVLSTLLAVGYARTRSDLSASRRAEAARAAELDVMTKRQAELASELSQTQAKVLDPAGYEQIKKCVREYAEDERAAKEFMKESPTTLPTALPNLPNSRFYVAPQEVGPLFLPLPTVCTSAEPYLK